MTEVPERDLAFDFHSADSVDRITVAASSEQNADQIRSSKVSLLSRLFASTFSIFEAHSNTLYGKKKVIKYNNYGWATAVRKAMTGGSMKRLQERLIGTSRIDVSSSTSEIWLLGSCYKILPESLNAGNGLVEFLQDFESRILITYRKGFDAIHDSKFTSDANWGCMIRSSQMLVAQALLFHHLGRSWRKPLQKPFHPEYIKILHLFGDSEAHAFSIHNLLQAGRGCGLAAGSWLGPYAMCRTWETIFRTNREKAVLATETLPMAVYIVSDDEDGERGGAPVVCIDVAARLCSDVSKDQHTWAPILFLVPLVLGVEKVNLRYIPLLSETFSFPQSLGILGGRPGASTYIVGVQDDKALYLDPHEVQPVVDIERDDLEADTSSYHCSTVRHLQLDQIDPSLAIGFYCRDRDDFDDFCSRASKLADKANGAPLFTVAQSLRRTPNHRQDFAAHSSGGAGEEAVDGDFGVANLSDCDAVHEDDWQFL